MNQPDYAQAILKLGEIAQGVNARGVNRVASWDIARRQRPDLATIVDTGPPSLPVTDASGRSWLPIPPSTAASATAPSGPLTFAERVAHRDSAHVQLLQLSEEVRQRQPKLSRELAYSAAMDLRPDLAGEAISSVGSAEDALGATIMRLAERPWAPTPQQADTSVKTSNVDQAGRDTGTRKVGDKTEINAGHGEQPRLSTAHGGEALKDSHERWLARAREIMQSDPGGKGRTPEIAYANAMKEG